MRTILLAITNDLYQITACGVLLTKISFIASIIFKPNWEALTYTIIKSEVGSASQCSR